MASTGSYDLSFPEAPLQDFKSAGSLGEWLVIRRFNNTEIQRFTCFRIEDTLSVGSSASGSFLVKST